MDSRSQTPTHRLSVVTVGVEAIYTSIMPISAKRPTKRSMITWAYNASNQKASDAILSSGGDFELDVYELNSELEAHERRIEILHQAQENGLQVTNNLPRCLGALRKHQMA
ncbi:hypothetical protein ACP3V3_03030 [Vibrio sp. PNB22_3_1]